MAQITIELKCKIAWWVKPFILAAAFVNRFISISEGGVLAIAVKGVKVEVVN